MRSCKNFRLRGTLISHFEHSQYYLIQHFIWSNKMSSFAFVTSKLKVDALAGLYDISNINSKEVLTMSPRSSCFLMYINNIIYSQFTIVHVTSYFN